MLISSHILEELSQLATMYCFIHEGRILEYISKSELDKQCRNHLNVRVNNSAKASAILEDKLKISDFVIEDGKVIKIYGKFDRPQDIAKCLIKNGFELYEMAMKQETLESYYMKLLLSAKCRGKNEAV